MQALDLAFAVGCVLAVWTALLLLLAGLGRGLLRLAGEAGPGLITPAWAGYAAAIAFLQVWHLALPVDGRAVALLAALSLAGWLLGRGAPRLSTPPLALLLGAGLAVLWLADRAIGPCVSYDSANYQLALVRWYRDFPAVPGLANLNPVYGLGLSGLLFPALLEQGPGAGRSHHFANGFLLFLLLLHLTRLAGGLFRGSGRPGPQHAMALVLLFPAVMLIHRAGGNWITSHVTDLPVTAVLFAAWCLIAEGLDERRARGDGGGLGPRLFAGLALLSIAPCLKPTTAVFAAAAWIALAAVLLLGSRFPPLPGRAGGEAGEGGQGGEGLRILVPALLFGTAAIVPWLARNVVLTGYPLFPAAVAGFDVDWRLPAEHAQGIVWWTRAYTRMPEAWDALASQTATSWIPYWLRMELRAGLLEALLPLGLSLLGAAAWIVRRRAPAGERGHPAVLLLPFLAALPAWFLSAPLVRYGVFLFWPLCAQVAAQVLPPLLAAPAVRRLLPAVVLAWALSPLALQAHYAVKYPGPRPPREVLAWLFFTPPGPDRGFHPSFRPAMETVRVCGSLDVSVPAAKAAVRDPAPWPETLPWDSPPPATSLLLPGLCPRRPGDLAGGFRIEDGGLPWPARNASEVAAVARRTAWPVGRLAVYFNVRPELIEESLRLEAGRIRP